MSRRSLLLSACVCCFVSAVASRVGANAPPGRYTVTSTTVYDNYTKLTWMRTVPGTTYPWSQAIAYCSGLGGAWRLPTVKELQTLFDVTQSGGFDPVAFPKAPTANYWSITPTAGSVSSLAWAVSFGINNFRAIWQSQSTTSYARCVQ